MADKVEFLVFCAIVIPFSLLTGFSAASVAFTAWVLVVPLLLGSFEFSLFDAIFISLLLDCFNGFLLGLLYYKKGQVSIKLSLLQSLSAVPSAFLVFWFTHEIIDENSRYLKSGAGYMEFALAVLFIIRGIREYRQAKEKQKNIQIQKEEESKASDETSPLLEKEQTYQVHWTINVLLGVLCLISGGMTGLIGQGSGMVFVIYLILLHRMNLASATGTGCLSMGILTAFMLLFCLCGVVHVQYKLMWPYILVAAPFSVIGSILGFFLASKISKVSLNFFIAVLLLILGTITTVQKYALSKVTFHGP